MVRAINLLNPEMELKMSYWINSTKQNQYPALDQEINVDVCIVGGGIAGITTAFLLKKEGVKVAVLDSGIILHSTTGHTTAKITSQHNLIYDKLVKKHSEEKARIYADANEAAINFIETLVHERNIDCDFTRLPAYVYTQDEKYIEKIEDEVSTTKDLDLKSSYVDNLPLPFPVLAAIKFDHQAQFHPLKYLLSLANDIPGDSSYIFENTRAVGIEENDGKCIVLTEKGYNVNCSSVVVASHFPFYDTPGLYFTRIYPDRSYILGVKIKEEFPDGMFINAEKPSRSLRYQPTDYGKLILIGGESHKTGQSPDTSVHYDNLIKFAKDSYTVTDIQYRWSTQDYTTMDELPYVGYHSSASRRIFVATGFAKWGMTNGTVSAMILKDLIVHGKNDWSEVYSPLRFTPVASIKNFINENINVAQSLISGKLKLAAQDLKVEKGEGKVVEIDGTKAGVYKDEGDEFHIVDVTCTHLGCELNWNQAEKSWDCPCHGSRFNIDGDIILNGPALKPLNKFS